MALGRPDGIALGFAVGFSDGIEVGMADGISVIGMRTSVSESPTWITFEIPIAKSPDSV